MYREYVMSTHTVTYVQSVRIRTYFTIDQSLGHMLRWAGIRSGSVGVR